MKEFEYNIISEQIVSVETANNAVSTELHVSFRDKERMKKRYLLVFLSLIFVLSWIAYLNDVSRIKNGKKSLFTYPFVYYKDGGSIYRVGVGYGVFQWNRMADRSINGIENHGHLVGTEIIPFPECYKILIDKKTPEPKIHLEFIYN